MSLLSRLDRITEETTFVEFRPDRDMLIYLANKIEELFADGKTEISDVEAMNLLSIADAAKRQFGDRRNADRGN